MALLLPCAHMLECLTLPASLSQTVRPSPFSPPPDHYVSLSLAEAYFDGATLFRGSPHGGHISALNLG